MASEADDGGRSAESPAATRCRRCNRSGPRCFCARLPQVPNRTLVRILQHPREQRHRAGTAPFVQGALERCETVVARERAGAIRGSVSTGKGCALLFPGPDSVDLRSLPAGGHPAELLVIDGTWSQAKRLYHDNPWLAELPKVHLDPEEPSRYLVRTEPQADYLSTVECVAEALTVMEPHLTEPLRTLRGVFESVMRDQHGLMTAEDRSPRMQRPRQRERRAVPLAFVREPWWVVHTEQVWCSMDDGGRALQPVHWAALDVSTGMHFEAVLRPPGGQPEAVHLGHVGIDADVVAAGESVDQARARFEELAGPAPSLCAWSRLPLRVLQEQGVPAGEGLLVKVLCANLRGPVGGGPESLAERLGLAVVTPPFVGRGAVRIGAVWSLARWVREQGKKLHAD